MKHHLHKGPHSSTATGPKGQEEKMPWFFSIESSFGKGDIMKELKAGGQADRQAGHWCEDNQTQNCVLLSDNIKAC